jgi:phospholipase A1/A2
MPALPPITLPTNQGTSVRAKDPHRRTISLVITACLLLSGAAGAQNDPRELLDPPPSAAGARTESEGKIGTAAAADDEGASHLTGNERPPAPDPVEFFRRHFFPFEPLYFIAGTESPNAKFQISLRYQLFTDEGWLASKWSGVTNFSVAYTQTSLWDWNEPSAPFFDSSYKPEINYTWLRVDGGHWGGAIRLDLRGGLQHESNGKGGADSRSLNLVYLWSTITFGRPGRFQLSVSPKAFVYLGDLSGNVDIADYRGYLELRAGIGWSDNVQLTATTRIGDDFDRTSLQLDLTYPMWRLPLLRSSVLLQAQYFTGYGESLLRYYERSDTFRAGIALFR